jgi:hypothetical protein
MQRSTLVRALPLAAAGAFGSVEGLAYSLAPAVMGVVLSAVAVAVVVAGMGAMLRRSVLTLRELRRRGLSAAQPTFAQWLSRARSQGWRVERVPRASRSSARGVVRLVLRLLPAKERERCIEEWVDMLDSTAADGGHVLLTALSLITCLPTLLWRSWRKALAPQRRVP